MMGDLAAKSESVRVKSLRLSTTVCPWKFDETFPDLIDSTVDDTDKRRNA